MKRLIVFFLLVAVTFSFSSCSAVSDIADILSGIADALRRMDNEPETDAFPEVSQDISETIEDDSLDDSVISSENIIVHYYVTEDGENAYVINPDISAILPFPSEEDPVSTAENEPVPTEEQEPKPEAGESKPADPPAKNDSASALVGEWVTASRSGDCIDTIYYWFTADGVVTTQDGEYVHSSHYPDLFPDFEPGWYGMPMGYPLTIGTYEIEGSNLILTFTHDDVGCTIDPPDVSEHSFSVSGDSMTLSGSTYLRGTQHSIKELAKLFDIDLSIDG